MTKHLFELESTGDPLRWRLPVTADLCAGPASIEPFLYGGMGLAAGMHAMQNATGRPVIWATAQYLSFARIGQLLDLDVTIATSGRSVTHARVSAKVDGKEIITVNAALGSRDDQPVDQWVSPPEIPAPDECSPRNVFPPQSERSGLIRQLDLRVPEGSPFKDRTGRRDSGRMAMWLRSTAGIAVDAEMLALFADFVPGAIVAAMGHFGGGSSLDNTLRICRIVPTEWVLCDIDVHGIASGMGHGDVRLFAQTGELMAVGSQSCVLSYFD